MLSYYLERGFPPEHILGLSENERLFYFASMIYREEQNGKRD